MEQVQQCYCIPTLRHRETEEKKLMEHWCCSKVSPPSKPLPAQMGAVLGVMGTNPFLPHSSPKWHRDREVEIEQKSPATQYFKVQYNP